MFEANFINFLDKKFDKVLPKFQSEYLIKFKALDFANDLNSYFMNFWVNYNDEIKGKFGKLYPFAYEVNNFEQSITQILRKHKNLPDNFYALYNFENDDFLFYDKLTDNVVFVKATNFSKFLENQYCDKKWQTFEEFLKDHLNYKPK